MYSLQTAVYDVAFNFVQFYEYKPQPAGGEPKTAVECLVQDMKPGLSYGDTNKIIKFLNDLKGFTIRAVDPGVHCTYTAVDLFTGVDEDVRNTAMMLRSTTFKAVTKSKYFGEKMKRLW